MAENQTVARPYAKAVFDCAVEQKNLDGWQAQLEAMAAATSDKVFLDMLKNAPSSDSAAKMLKQLLDGLLDDYGSNLIDLLGENGRYEVVPDIYREFVQMRDEYEKVLKAQVITARELDSKELDAIKEKLALRYGSSKVELECTLDPAIIGGAILKVGDEVIDASVKTSLSNLSSTLK